VAVTGSLTLRTRGVVESTGGTVTASIAPGSTRIFLNAEPTGWDDEDFPKAIQFESIPFLGFLIKSAGTIDPAGVALSGPYVDIYYPITQEILANSAWYMVNVVATENFTLSFDVETLRAGRENGVGYVRVAASPGPEHEGGHVAGLVGDSPIASWSVTGSTSATDTRNLNSVLNVASGVYSIGDMIQIGDETNAYTVTETSGATVVLNRPLRPLLFGVVSTATGFYSTSSINSYTGKTSDASPADPHSHGMTHTHAFPSFATVIPFSSATGVTISTGSYILVRGSEYRVAAFSSSTVTIDGGLSGPVFNGDDIYAVTIPGNTPIRSTVWQHRGTITMPPIEYTGHVIITEAISLYESEAAALAGTPLDNKTYKFGRATPLTYSRKISSKVYELQDRTLAPGEYTLYGYGISNKWGTQTLGMDSPGVEFTQPSELGYKAGA
jgi:hypothetical protein